MYNLDMEKITLNNKKQIPVIGLGTWRSDKNKLTPIVEYSIIECDYRHVDCASIYKNEKEIGQALKRISSNKISREELFITSKLRNTDHHPDNVEEACKKTLKDLQLKYLDLYLMHWGIAIEHGQDLEPIGSNGLVKTEKVPIIKTWKAMEKLVKKGLVKSIGIANFSVSMIIDLLSYSNIKPVINQVEIHPYNSQQELVNFCHKINIQITAYSPLGSSGDIKKRPIYDRVVIQIANKYKKTPAQILIKWSLQRGLIVIPKSIDLLRIKENIDVFNFKLLEIDMAQINKLNKNYRFVDPVIWWGIPYFK